MALNLPSHPPRVAAQTRFSQLTSLQAAPNNSVNLRGSSFTSAELSRRSHSSEWGHRPLQTFWQSTLNTCLHKQTNMLWQNYSPLHSIDTALTRSRFGICMPNMQSTRTSLTLRSSLEPSTPRYIFQCRPPPLPNRTCRIYFPRFYPNPPPILRPQLIEPQTKLLNPN
jgi:hypothetical protein